ncbi:DNA polymerase III subunit alpha [Sphingobacteriales bacterium UPWRP_1]|nr:DNA polymerase III subunit alpha [Sphingobacteriales bacterium UPWRP_1]
MSAITFNHLHCHTQFSLLDGAAGISKMYQKAVKDGMRGMAITDHGNMLGVFEFVAEAGKNNNQVKPIVGCEFYLVENRHKKQFTKEDKDKRYHQLFLAKNAEGYRNLVKMCSLGYIEGLYGKYPRIDKELVLQYHQGLIATTCCLGAEVPQTIMKKGEAEARKVFEWWFNIFGDDYYIELQRHHLKEQDVVNQTLLKFAKEYNVKIIATNDSHYVDREDANAHDILLCLNTGEKQSTPKMDEFIDDSVLARNRRFAFPNDEFYFKTTHEMHTLFKDVPQALDNTNEIVDKIEPLKLKQDILLPHFQVPDGFTNQDDYLRHITFEGAHKRYKEITPEIEERLNFELFTIKTMGFAGYFLIVADFIAAGREIGVLVGPGRGSAAGSAVAYCIGITNIDPIHYQLLFERFLNPDRKSMPDIDTDFDDEGRQKVIDYVVKKYGRQQVAQIVTYGTMAAKMSIKDVARVMDLPLAESNALAKLVPEKPGISLNRLLKAPLTGDDSLTAKEALMPDDIENAKQLRQILEGDDLRGKVLKEALVLEGSVRGTGIHAAGIIIAPKDLTEIIPVCTTKETDLLVTQFEGKIIEDAGVIKMDFLGLKTLTIMRDALLLIEQNHGVKIDLDSLPLDDPKTYELYQKGETNGTFQFESAGMQKHLRDLKPDRFSDLIAMNALYRPGPLEYIPNYIARKHGREKISYDLPEMQEFLEDTFGITVYQEQVMLLSQKLASFTKGDADVLRKAMGKKQKAVLDKMKVKFIEGSVKKGHPGAVCEKIWTDWEAFASYAFNKSHSTCYALVAYQTAYLKAHYPAEYMAAVLTHNQSQIEKITFFMDECRRMGIPVKGPDINESDVHFSVNLKGEIRFALSAIKGVGEAAVEEIIRERKNNGPFKGLFDFAKRVNLRTVNKKSFESMSYAGAFDCFGLKRAQFFFSPVNEQQNLIEKAIKFGGMYQQAQQSSQASLFGNSYVEDVPEPPIPDCEEFPLLERLTHERDTIGIYLTGHPLDEYRITIGNFCNCQFTNIENNKNKELAIGCMVTEADHRTTKNGRSFGRFLLEDFSGSFELTLFGDDYINFKNYFEKGRFLFIRGRFQPNWNRTSEELKVQQVKLLSTVLEDLSKKITLTVPLARVNKKFIDQLEELCLRHPGNMSLTVRVNDSQTNYSADLFSNKYRLAADLRVFDTIGQWDFVSYRLN